MINFREEESRLELWKCLLNLRFFFGEDPAQFRATFFEVLAANVKKPVMDHVEVLCKAAGRFELGESLLEEYLKRVESKEDAWLKYLKFLLEVKSSLLQQAAPETPEFEAVGARYKEKVRSVLRRSLQSLQKHRHVFFLARYAVLEYKNQDAEVGRSNFENLVSSFPNRSDLWGVYLDMEIKYYDGNLEGVRSLFDRVLALSSLKMKTAKNVFKKLLKFEERHGGKGRAAAVKQRAADFVRSRADPSSE